MNQNSIIRYSYSSVMALLLLSANTVKAEVNDSTKAEKLFEGSVYTEVNVGHHHYEEHPALWDFPHLVVDGQLNLGRGWTVNPHCS